MLTFNTSNYNYHTEKVVNIFPLCTKTRTIIIKQLQQNSSYVQAVAGSRPSPPPFIVRRLIN